jgi:hypothetical protein
MRFYCFESHGSSRLGVGSSDGKQVLDLTAVAPELPKNPLDFVAGFASTQSIVRQIIQSKQSSNWTYDLDSLQLLAPIPRPGKIAHGGKSLYMRNASIGQTANGVTVAEEGRARRLSRFRTRRHAASA